MRSLFIALLMAFPPILFAQANYQAGFVVKNNGDTVKGYVDYREWAYSPTSIRFKPQNSTNITEFGADAIKGFQITGLENYVSYIGFVSVNKNVFPDVPSNLDTTRQQMSIFLKQLVAGNNVTLYYNNEQYKNRFFIAEAGRQPVELQYYEYYVAGGSEEKFDNLYRGQLILLNNKFKNASPKILGFIADAKYNEPDLVRIATSLNDENKTISIKANNIDSHARSIRFFAGLGINDATTTYQYTQSVVNTTNSSGTTSVYNLVSYHSTTIAPKINLGLDLFTNPNVQQFIFRSELSLSYSNGLFNRNVGNLTGNLVSFDYKFTQYTASLTPQFLFNVYNTDKLKFYIDAGVTLNLSAYNINNMGESSQTPLQLESFWAYFPLQAGVVFNKQTEIYLTYTTGARYSDYADFSVSNRYLCLGYKYLFK